MEVSGRNEFCVMECGEEELVECQVKFYYSKQNDLDELLKMIVISQIEGNADRLPDGNSPSQSNSASLYNLLSRPVITPKPRPLVVLDPATLNQLATSNGYKAPSSSSSSNVPVSAGHSLPALAPNFTLPPIRAVSTSVPTSSGIITLSDILNDSPPPALLRFPAPSPPQAAYVPQTPSAVSTLSDILNGSPPPARQGYQRFPMPSPPQAAYVPPIPSAVSAPHGRAVSQVRIRTPVGQVPGQVRVRPPPSYASSEVRVVIPSTATNGIVPPAGPRYPTPAPAPTSQLLTPPSPKNAKVRSTVSIIDEMQRNVCSFPECPYACEHSGNGSNSINRPPLPPPDLPLLPETRPETASDSRPRPRPGPASQTQRLPSSLDNETSSDMVDLTQDDQSQPTAMKTSSKEKTFPSLIVTARASLKIIPPVLINNERLLMDNQIRKVMQMSPPVFTEYLLQQRLLKSEQFCKEHNAPLRLGIYADPKRFPVSGGYVWIADCCKSGFCSVYSGSIFDKTIQPPANIIKLMYHWCCNTAVHNVLNWVKVDSYIMKTYYTFYRAICTTVVHEKYGLLGGNHKKIQVGVISIGTFPDGSAKEVKVDIMAVMDPDTYALRLKVLENFLSDSNKVYESKFRKILEVLKDWVDPKSTIITDFAVDLALCRQYGFSNLVVSGGKHSADNNCAVMDYMRAKIPLMFQNTLGLLSYTIIQQFLDELVWRETWGPYPSRAYDTLVQQICELTKLPGPDLITKLKCIASEPTKDWKYSVWKDDGEPVPSNINNKSPSIVEVKNPTSSGKRVNKRVREYVGDEKRKGQNKMDRVPPIEDTQREKANEPVDRPSSVDPAVKVPMAMIPQSQLKTSDKRIFLEPFYYGVVDGDPARQKRTGSFLAECILCKRDFLSASSFTNHLIHHALNSHVSQIPPDQLLNACALCCKPVTDVESHRKDSHPYPPYPRQSYVCKICRLDLKSEEKIVKHMTAVHQELDVPYKCDLCHFQTSIFDSAVLHFKDFHDKEYCVRCPYCFKIVRFCSKNGLEIPQNQYYFVQHIQKHSVNKLNRKCEKCVLSFTNMATLKQHQERVHKRSGKFLKNIKRLKYDLQKMLIMSIPMQPPLPPVTLHESSFHTLKGKALSSSVLLPEYYAVCACLECDGPMTQNHFSVKMTCTRCSFQSSCANSIREHSARRHHVVDNPGEQQLRSQIIGGSASLEKPLYCSYCAFTSKNGNKMAAHLVDCGDGGALATSDKRKPEALMSPSKVQRQF